MYMYKVILTAETVKSSIMFQRSNAVIPPINNTTDIPEYFVLKQYTVM